MTLTLLPAVDLLDGQAARLVQGAMGTETAYGDPVRAASAFAEQGAAWLHVVDLDAAFGRGPRNRDQLARVVKAVAPVRVEASGGVRTADDLAVGLDARGRVLQARGWTSSGGDLFATLARLDASGCRRFVYTEVARDGMLTGPALASLGEVLAATDRPVIASGGVSSLDDLRALAPLAVRGLEGVIVGKALYAGRFTVAEALATLSGNGGSS